MPIRSNDRKVTDRMVGIHDCNSSTSDFCGTTTLDTWSRRDLTNSLNSARTHHEPRPGGSASPTPPARPQPTIPTEKP